MKYLEHIDKSTLTYLRAGNVTTLPYIGNEVNRINRLENQYGKYLLMPFDAHVKIPDDFATWYFSTAKETQRNTNKRGSNNHRSAHSGLGNQPGGTTWVNISGAPETYDHTSSGLTKNIVNDFKLIWPQLWEDLMDSLPYESLDYWTIWSSVRPVRAHRDRSYFLDIPIDFRVNLYDENDKNTLYVFENSPTDQQGDLFYLNKDFESNVWAWNSLRLQHGSDYVGKKKILFIPNIRNPINWDKYEEMLEQSVKKYHNNDSTFKSTKSIGEFVENVSLDVNGSLEIVSKKDDPYIKKC